MSNKTTPKPGAPAAPAEAPRNPRDSLIDDMADRLYGDRVTDADAESEAFGTPDSTGVRPEEREEAGTPAAKSADTDWWVQDADGNTFMRAKVDGEEKLIPLDKVRATIQKNEAADARLLQASQIQKDLETREMAVRQAEARIQQGTATPRATTPAPLPRGEDDQVALLKEAKSIISDLFEGNEDDAASKLANVIASSRVSQGTSLNAEEIARQAADGADQIREARENNKALQKGWVEFKKDFPDLVADRALFAATDAHTDVVQIEHPDWTPTEIMAEAGKHIRARFNLKAPGEEKPAATDRLEDKRKLRPMPVPAQDTRRPPEPEKPPTARETLEDIRRARGQSV